MQPQGGFSILAESGEVLISNMEINEIEEL
jgi:hypothetical protein